MLESERTDVEYESCKNDYMKEKERCSSKVLNSEVLPGCSSVCRHPYIKTPHPFVAKVPVVKKICNININVKAHMKLEKYATDIKNIDKEICITQCTLCPIYTPYKDYKWDKYQLFLEGYVKKNIRYCHATCEAVGKNGCVSGEVLCTTCKIPFECSTTIELPSSYGKENEPSFQEEYKNLNKSKLCKDPNMKHLINYGNYSEEPYCELINYVISECDFVEKPRVEGNFKKLEEKMVISVTLRIMQKEEMFIKNQEPKKYCENNKNEGKKEYYEDEMYDEHDC